MSAKVINKIKDNKIRVPSCIMQKLTLADGDRVAWTKVGMDEYNIKFIKKYSYDEVCEKLENLSYYCNFKAYPFFFELFQNHIEIYDTIITLFNIINKYFIYDEANIETYYGFKGNDIIIEILSCNTMNFDEIAMRAEINKVNRFLDDLNIHIDITFSNCRKWY